MTSRVLIALLGTLLAIQSALGAQARKPNGRPLQDSKCNDVPAHAFDIILSRPTSNSITASVLCYADAQGAISYGTDRNNLANRTPTTLFQAGQPANTLISGLKPDTQYFYKFSSSQAVSEVFTFRTARPPKQGFTFTVIADSHLDENTDPAVYMATISAARSQRPDFHIDLGDTFMTEKAISREAAARQYLAQRYYFGQLCHSAPLFLVLGNHDGESPRGQEGESSDLAVWSCTTRKRYFPNPVPDCFYTGNSAQHPDAGLLEDYYSWTWGDALFVVLDPFWYSESRRDQGGGWKRTLGKEQYNWLKNTLEESHAGYKFIFIHHLVGGLDEHSRGGSEAAPLYEWGGRNADGTPGFSQHRPGWSAPIHQLLVTNHVSVVFHGHDHLYAMQTLDGIIYQEVPQPGNPGNNRAPRSAAEYGYLSGTILGSSGHIMVTVSRTNAQVAYIRPDRSVAHSYLIHRQGK